MSRESSLRPPSAIVLEVAAAFERYEDALIRNDVALLNDFFLHRDDTVRFGIREQCYGYAAISAWRSTATSVAPGRQILRRVIAPLGDDVACVSTEFSDPSTPGVGRQSQTWLRTPLGWKIAAAHVSMATS